MNINHHNLLDFGATHKIKYMDMRLLAEAFRRKHFLQNKSGWFGLGTYAVYGKCKYFKEVNNVTGYVPRVNYWWKLTEDGERIMQLMEQYFEVPENTIDRNKKNEELFTL